jgi:hypothetical protein
MMIVATALSFCSVVYDWLSQLAGVLSYCAPFAPLYRQT